MVDQVLACKNEKFVDPVYEVPLDAPVILCEQYGTNVCYHLTNNHAMPWEPVQISPVVETYSRYW